MLITDECIGVFQLLMARARAVPKVYAYGPTNVDNGNAVYAGPSIDCNWPMY